jgi:hypothetical protein
MKYTIDYFIALFDELPEEYWSLSTEVNPTDAWAWVQNGTEATALYFMIKPFGFLVQVNDGAGAWAGYANSPKERVIKFLNMIKNSFTEERAC